MKIVIMEVDIVHFYELNKTSAELLRMLMIKALFIYLLVSSVLSM